MDLHRYQPSVHTKVTAPYHTMERLFLITNATLPFKVRSKLQRLDCSYKTPLLLLLKPPPSQT